MLCLVQDGHLHLDQPVSQWADELRESLFADVDLRQLLSHQAGLPAWRPYYEQLAPSELPPRNEEERRQRAHALLNAIASEPIEYQPGSQSLYSDLGFMVLGEIVERCAPTGYSVSRRPSTRSLERERDAALSKSCHLTFHCLERRQFA